MKSSPASASKAKVFLTWVKVLALLIAIFGFCTWWFSRRPAPGPSGSEPDIVYSVVMVFAGVLFLGAGAVGYLIAIFTQCFTFNFSHSVWSALKVKLYFANIFVPLGIALGFGFFLTAVLSPVLMQAGLDRSLANIVPVMGMIFLMQVAQLWILIWGPLEKRIILKRLAALDITPEQLQSAFLVGLSNPAKKGLKRLGTIEEDVGALWVGPEHLIYWGDGEQFGLTQSQIIEIERKADSGSTSMLGGITHVILHVSQPDGSVRQIRLHNEGLFTMGQKRVAMERLAGAIAQWHGAAPIQPVAPMGTVLSGGE